ANPEIAKPRIERFGIDIMLAGEGGNVGLVLRCLGRGSQAPGCAGENSVSTLRQHGADLADIAQQQVWPARRYQAGSFPNDNVISVAISGVRSDQVKRYLLAIRQGRQLQPDLLLRN